VNIQLNFGAGILTALLFPSRLSERFEKGGRKILAASGIRTRNLTLSASMLLLGRKDGRLVDI